jgi:O-antigen/teichoic acid export membrane protein
MKKKNKALKAKQKNKALKAMPQPPEADKTDDKSIVARSRFGRHVLTLVGGAVIAQAIPMAVMPLLTRLYTPSDFAALTGYVALVSVLGGIIAGRYEMTIMQAANSLEADRLTMMSLSVTIVMTLLLSVVAATFAKQISSAIGIPELLPWMNWLALPLFATGAMQIFSNRLNWQKNYKDIASGRVIQNSSNVAASLVLGWGKVGVNGMLFGHIVGLWYVALYFWYKTKLNIRSFDLLEVLALAKRYVHYPLYSAPAALLDVASMYACIFILGRFYSNEILGQFSLTHRLLLVPMVFVGAAVAQTFFQRAAEYYRQGESLRLLLVTTSKKMLIYSLPLFALLVVLAPELFAWIFGSGWREAGEYARWVALAYWVRLGVSPVSTIFMVVHKVKIGTLWQVIYFFFSFTVLGLAAIANLPIRQFFMVYAVHEVIMYALYFYMAYRVCSLEKLNSDNLCAE